GAPLRRLAALRRGAAPGALPDARRLHRPLGGRRGRAGGHRCPAARGRARDEGTRRRGGPARGVTPGGGHNARMATELLFLDDAYQRTFTATVTAVDAGSRRVALDRTAFYPTGGGQPHDTGRLGDLPVVDVRKDGSEVWHTVGGGGALPA